MKNALIVIDVQNDYFPDGAWAQFQAAETVARIADCVRSADAAGWLVAAVRHVNAADAVMLAVGSAGAAFYPTLAPLLANRPTVDKRAADACAAPDERIHAVAVRALSARLDVLSAAAFQAALTLSGNG